MDGSGNVYVGGDFTFIGTVPANSIAPWNGSAWAALGSGHAAGMRSGWKPLAFALAASNARVGASAARGCSDAHTLNIISGRTLELRSGRRVQEGNYDADWQLRFQLQVLRPKQILSRL
jgi:hypothetical protein